MRDKKDKPLKSLVFKGLVVAGIDEISNFRLVRDLVEIVEFLTDSKSYLDLDDNSKPN